MKKIIISFLFIVSAFTITAQTGISHFKMLEKSATSITVAWVFTDTQPSGWEIAYGVHPVTSPNYIGVDINNDLQAPVNYHLETTKNIQIYVVKGLNPDTIYDIFLRDSDNNTQVSLTNIRTNRQIALSDEISSDESLCNSYKPIVGKEYLLSAWVKVAVKGVYSYENTGIQVVVNKDSTIYYSNYFEPKGMIIDGWQRIEGTFRIPADTPVTVASINIELINNNSDKVVYFDDIRIFPKNGNLKSFVYDIVTKKLMAELDENNFATFYEYDQEGGLIRIKKETERGVYTIQETRSNTKKNN